MRWRLWCVLGMSCLLPLAQPVPGFGDGAPKEEVDKLVERTTKLAQAKKFAEAASTMKKVIEFAPKNDRYLAQASDFEREAGNFAAGLAYAQRAIKINDKVGTYYVLAAVNAFANQDLALARGYVQTIRKRGDELGAGALAAAKSIEGVLVKKTYTIFWDLNPKNGRSAGGIFQVALPKDMPYQSVKYKVTGAKSYRVVKGEANDVLNVVPQGTTPFQVTMTVGVQPFSYKARLAARKIGKAVPKSVRPYLGPSEGIDPTSPKMAKVVASLKDRDSAKTVRNISTWMSKNITYQHDKKSGVKLDFKTADELLERRHAECRGYAILFTALCRAAGVPARPVWGVVILPPHRGGALVSHNWLEVYIPGTGWVPVDPQAPETFGCLPNTHVRLFMDMKRRATSAETLPQLNLLYMNGEKLKHEVRADSLDGPSSSGGRR